MAAEPALRALFLAGSHGRDAADAHSDLDFLGVADPAEHPQLAKAWQDALSAERALVYCKTLFHGSLVNAITEDWLRIDLFLSGPDGLARRSQAELRPVLDPEGLYATLVPAPPPPAPDPARVEATTLEFLRVLGLLAVGAGRDEHVLLVRGLGILRDLLIDLMHEENPPAFRGGALHISRTLPAADMALLQALPYPGPDRAALIAAHGALAAVFLPRARALHDRLGLAWPGAFEAATRRYLAREVGLDLG
jgi:hypothetical protein